MYPALCSRMVRVIKSGSASAAASRASYGSNSEARAAGLRYVAGHWHSDRAGRRLKLFVYLHDVDPVEGHPTLVAKGSQHLVHFSHDSYANSRYRDEFVRGEYEVLSLSGRRGQGFLFDTNALHKGTPEGMHRRDTLARRLKRSNRHPSMTVSSSEWQSFTRSVSRGFDLLGSF